MMACMRSERLKHALLIPYLSVIGVLVGCSNNPVVSINAMQAPDIYQQGQFDPFPAPYMNQENLPDAIFYATDRQPSEDLSVAPYYLKDRGHVLRLGTAKVALQGVASISDTELQNSLLLKDRSRDYPIQIESVNEIGILDHSYEELLQQFLPDSASAEPRTRYAELINERLDSSDVKDIYIYVHGYKVFFDNPVLVSSELWHFLGYQGAFIAYAWPSTPSRWSYAADLETTDYTARHFRQFIQYLADETKVEKIHIIGYSAGTRVVIDALRDLALLNHSLSDEQMATRYRIGQVILAGSDYDRDMFIAAILDRLLDIPDRVTVYRSGTDSALGVSQFVLSRRRLGEIMADEGVSESDVRALKSNQELHFIDVSEAENAGAGNGHNYFRQSPWVSSDVLTTLRYQLEPHQRGLVHAPGSAIWTFPVDYPRQVHQGILENLSDAKVSRPEIY